MSAYVRNGEFAFRSKLCSTSAGTYCQYLVHPARYASRLPEVRLMLILRTAGLTFRKGPCR
jgi:hypothetical protein